MLASLLTSGAALADQAGLSRCRGIADATARLACYDALFPPIDPAARFGRERQIEDSAAHQDAIETYIPGVFEGWQPRTRIRLANGQVWQVTDDSSGSYRLVDPRVIVRRGLLGAFFMELTSENRSIKVRRVD